jgi:hypothetical protein
MFFENNPSDNFFSSKTSAIVSPGAEAQLGRNVCSSVMTFSNPHDLDAIHSAPVYFLIFINGILYVVCGKFEANTIRERDLVIFRGLAFSGGAHNEVPHATGSFQIGQSVSEAAGHILGKLSRRGFLVLADFTKRL